MPQSYQTCLAFGYLKFFLLLFGQFKILHTFAFQLNPTIMKNIILFLAATLGFQANAQIKALEGVKLEYAKPGISYFTLDGLNDSDSADYFAYKLLADLNDECLSVSELSKGYFEDLSFGYLFRFKEQNVWYLCYSGGLVMGSVYEVAND
jgi:hypothetical protein